MTRDTTTSQRCSECEGIGRVAPTSEKELVDRINGFPEWLRSFIHDLETRCDPAGDIRDLWCQKQNNVALSRKVSALQRLITHPVGAKPISITTNVDRGQIRDLCDANERIYRLQVCECINPPDGNCEVRLLLVPDNGMITLNDKGA